MSLEGYKNDDGKARFDLIPPEGLWGVAQVAAIGAKKYGDRNWENGLSWGRLFAAMMRHAWAWMMGEDHDQEDGQHHMASVAWCAMAIMALQARGNGIDSRPRDIKRL